MITTILFSLQTATQIINIGSNHLKIKLWSFSSTDNPYKKLFRDTTVHA